MQAPQPCSAGRRVSWVRSNVRGPGCRIPQQFVFTGAGQQLSGLWSTPIRLSSAHTQTVKRTNVALPLSLNATETAPFHKTKLPSQDETPRLHLPCLGLLTFVICVLVFVNELPHAFSAPNLKTCSVWTCACSQFRVQFRNAWAAKRFVDRFLMKPRLVDLCGHCGHEKGVFGLHKSIIKQQLNSVCTFSMPDNTPSTQWLDGQGHEPAHARAGELCLGA